METYRYWCIFRFYFFWRVYEEYLHSLTSSLSGGHTMVKRVPPPLLFVYLFNRHPSDCQGISQVVIQLTLTRSSDVIRGSSPCPSVSAIVETHGLVWNTLIACLAAGRLRGSLNDQAFFF